MVAIHLTVRRPDVRCNVRYTLNPHSGIDDVNRTRNTDECSSKFPALYSANTVMVMNTKIYVEVVQTLCDSLQG